MYTGRDGVSRGVHVCAELDKRRSASGRQKILTVLVDWSPTMSFCLLRRDRHTPVSSWSIFDL